MANNIPKNNPNDETNNTEHGPDPVMEIDKKQLNLTDSIVNQSISFPCFRTMYHNQYHGNLINHYRCEGSLFLPPLPRPVETISFEWRPLPPVVKNTNSNTSSSSESTTDTNTLDLSQNSPLLPPIIIPLLHMERLQRLKGGNVLRMTLRFNAIYVFEFTNEQDCTAVESFLWEQLRIQWNHTTDNLLNGSSGGGTLRVFPPPPPPPPPHPTTPSPPDANLNSETLHESLPPPSSLPLPPTTILPIPVPSHDDNSSSSSSPTRRITSTDPLPNDTLSSLTGENSNEFLPETFGICGLNGYARETYRCFDTCKDVRTDQHLQQSLTIVHPSHRRSTRYRIQYACLTGNSAMFKLLWKEHDTSLLSSLRTPSGCTLLHLLGKKPDFHLVYENIRGRIEIFRILMQITAAPFDLCATNDQEETPFFLAVKPHKLELIDEFLTMADRIDLNRGNHQGTTPLLFACQRNFTEIVQRLCRLPSIDVTKSDYFGNTPLRIAIQHSSVAIMDSLLVHRERIDINQQTGTRNDTILHYAVRTGNLVIVQRFLNSFTNINFSVRCNEGETIFLAAVAGGNVAIVNELLLRYRDQFSVHAIRTTDNYNCLMIATCAGQLPMVQRLLDFNDPQIVSYRDPKGDDALTLAVVYSQPEIFDVLYAVVPDKNLNRSNRKGDSLLHRCCREGNLRMLQRLLRTESIDINITNGRGYTPWEEAIFGEYADIIRRAFLDPTINTHRILWTHRNPSEGESFFHRLCRDNKYADTVHQFLTVPMVENFDTYVPNREGYSPFLIAVNSGQYDIVRVFLASSNCADYLQSQNPNTGQMAIHLACLRNDLSMVRLLLDQPETVINITDTSGCTGFSYAVAKGYLPIVKEFFIHIRTKERIHEICNLPDNDGNTPLHTGIMNHHDAVVQYLLNYGTSSSSSSIGSSSRSSSTDRNSNGVIVRTDVPNNAGQTPLLLANELGLPQYFATSVRSDFEIRCLGILRIMGYANLEILFDSSQDYGDRREKLIVHCKHHDDQLDGSFVQSVVASWEAFPVHEGWTRILISAYGYTADAWDDPSIRRGLSCLCFTLEEDQLKPENGKNARTWLNSNV